MDVVLSPFLGFAELKPLLSGIERAGSLFISVWFVVLD